MPLPRKFRRAAIEATATTGGFFRDFDRHSAVHFQRGETLIVTFDNMKSRDMPVPRYPWAHQFVAKQGHSHLGIMMKRRNDWFRHRQLCDFFDELRDSGFFDRFDDVVFYGSSMGGYGALTYASACPRARAIAFSPQSTLSPELVPWERRYENARLRGDWSEPRYADAAETTRALRKALVFYDPYMAEDRAHADRLAVPGVVHLPCPFLGHKIPRYLAFWGLLGTVVRGAIDDTLSDEAFLRMIRVRRDHKSYVREVLSRAVAQGHGALARRALEGFAARRSDIPAERLARQIGLAPRLAARQAPPTEAAQPPAGGNSADRRDA